MENKISLEEGRREWEIAEVKMQENQKVLDSWRASNYKNFDELFEFKTFTLQDGYAQGGAIIIKKTGKKHIFKEWGAGLRSACSRAIRNAENEKRKETGSGLFEHHLMRAFLEEWIDIQEKK